MFTGLIEDIGHLTGRTQRGGDVSLVVATRLPRESLALGDSVAVNGACLTVTHLGDGTISFDASSETVTHTSLGDAKVGDPLHLERALRVGDRLGGHFVLGHVDGTGRLVRREQRGASWDLWVALPPELAAEMIPKGSIAVDGVSLTVNDVAGAEIRLTIIPHTGARTLLLEGRVPRRVNIETDVLGKYVRRFMQPGGTPSRLETLLSDFGYTSGQGG